MAAVLFISMVVFLLLGLPIAFVLCGSSVLALAVDGKMSLNIVIQRMFSGSGSFTLLAVPFFVLAGNLMSAGGIGNWRMCNLWLFHVGNGRCDRTSVKTAAYRGRSACD